MKYRAGYKYQLAAEEIFMVPIEPKAVIDTEFISLSTKGLLKIRSGYAWDGPSGPTIDTRSGMRGSLAHDALYQLIRQRYLGEYCRKIADDFLYRVLKADGMNSIRAWLWWRGVRRGAGYAASPESKKKIHEAP